MKDKYSAEELTTFSFHDSLLHKIAWENDGNDLALSITWHPPKNSNIPCPSGKTETQLYCTYVTNLLIEMNFDEFFGAPFIYEVHFSSVPHQRWQVEIEFLSSPNGKISFLCNDLILYVTCTTINK